ncbi:MAG: HEAT repeat domain-containing protein [Elusimicrobia bacterium]|nr:HEAT repeat domain-containing protein [Elusimicrobiota bacterium]
MNQFEDKKEKSQDSKMSPENHIPPHLKDIIDINVKIQMLMENFDNAYTKGDITAQKNVIKKLGQLGSVKVIPLLLSQLENVEIAATVIEQLGLIGDRSVVPFLIEEINNSRTDIRAAVAQALAFLDSENVIPYLCKLLKDSNETVRSSAADAFSHFVSEQAVSVLVKTAISDPSVSVRAHATSSLMTIVVASPTLCDELLEIFEKVKSEQSSQIFCSELERVIEKLKNISNLIYDTDHLTIRSKNLEENLKKSNTEIAELRQKLDELTKEKEIPATIVPQESPKKKKTILYRAIFITTTVVLIAGITIVGSLYYRSEKQKEKAIRYSEQQVEKLRQFQEKLGKYKEAVAQQEAVTKSVEQELKELKEKMTVAERQKYEKPIREKISYFTKKIKDMSKDEPLMIELFGEKTRDIFVQCKKAFLQTEEKELGLELAYKKKTGFYKAAEFAWSGKPDEAMKKCRETAALK